VGRWIRAVLTALVIAALPSALAQVGPQRPTVSTGQTQPVQSSSPSACSFLSAPGAVPAFCDTFDQPAGTGNRSGDLNGTVWGVSRLLGGVNSGQGQYYDASPTIMQKCGVSVSVQPPNDVAICNGQVVEAQTDQHGVTSLAMYPKQPFDIAGRTGTVAFDVSDDSHGAHRAWPEFWYTDKPMPAPFTHFSSLQEVPKDGFGVRFDAFCPAFGDPGCGIRPACPEYPISVSVISVGSADVINNYATNDSFTDVTPGPISVQVVGCVKASSGPGDMNHFELRVSQNEIDVYGVDAGAAGPLKKIAVITNMSLTLTRGLVWLEDVHYNGDKDGPDQGTHTFTWDNLAFDGPILPRDLAFDVLDRLSLVGPGYPGLLNLGWPLSPGGPPLTLMVSGVYNIDKAAAAILTFNYSTDNPITLSYRVNTGVWHDQPWPFGACFSQGGFVSCGSKTISVPVPLSEVQPGTNTIQFKTADTTNNLGISNVDLILVGAGGIVCTLNCPTTTTLTSSNNPSNFGEPVTFTATVTSSGIPSGSVTFNDSTTALGTVALNSNGVSTFTTSALAIGNHMINAVYGGNANFTGSTGSLNTNPQVVNRARSTTALTSSANPLVFGQSTTFTATVAAVALGVGTPTGTVQFKDGVANLGSPVTLSSGTAASPPITSLSPGTHSITAVYSGDTNFSPSTSPVLNQFIYGSGSTATTTTISNVAVANRTPGQELSKVHLKQTITMTVTVSTASGIPSGNVALVDNGVPLGPNVSLPQTGSTQVVMFEPLQVGLGKHNIVATYFGDATFQQSSSAPSVMNHTPRPR